MWLAKREYRAFHVTTGALSGCFSGVLNNT
jgi:hypothetical protein